MVNPIQDVMSWAERTPDALAIKSVRLEMTYSVFADTVRRIAAKLRASGVRPGDVVGLRMAPELQAVFVAAVMHEAAVSFAAKTSNVASRREQIHHIFTDDQLFESANPTRQLVNETWLAGTAHLSTRIEPTNFESPESDAILMFSSGTTGAPKGIAFSVQLLNDRIIAANKNWMPAEAFMSELGLDTVSGLLTYFYNLTRGQIYLVPGGAVVTVSQLQTQNIGAIKTSPAKLADLVKQANSAGTGLPQLQSIQVAGGLISAHLATQVAQTFKAKLICLYGSTEVGTLARGAYEPTQPNRVGKILPEVQVEIVDENGSPVGVGVGGNIRAKSAYQATEYWRDATQSSATFKSGWFWPGDRGYVDRDGNLFIEGRSDELINAGGAKLNPAWVDIQLAGYRGFKDHAAFAATDANSGEAVLGLAIVTDEPVAVEQLKANLRELLGGSAPQVIVRVAEIARNELGKPLRGEIAKLYASHLTNRERK
jgi:long-chain acyl-CoA synthetase